MALAVGRSRIDYGKQAVAPRGTLTSFTTALNAIVTVAAT
jgi:hypothetical protein